MQVYGAKKNQETIMCRSNHCGGKFAWCYRNTKRGKKLKLVRRKTARQEARKWLKDYD